MSTYIDMHPDANHDSDCRSLTALTAITAKVGGIDNGGLGLRGAESSM